MPMTTDTNIGHGPHGHHKVAAAIFVGSLILGAAIVMAAELTKPPQYEFRPGADPSAYVLFDAETGRATMAKVDSKNPTEALETK
jgi:hypothetical protein